MDWEPEKNGIWTRWCQWCFNHADGRMVLLAGQSGYEGPYTHDHDLGCPRALAQACEEAVRHGE